MYQITIDYALNGIICQIGCQRIVFTRIADFIEELDLYLREPRKTEARWRKNMQMFNALSPEIPEALEQPILATAPPPPPPDNYGLTSTQVAAREGIGLRG